MGLLSDAVLPAVSAVDAPSGPQVLHGPVDGFVASCPEARAAERR